MPDTEPLEGTTSSDFPDWLEPMAATLTQERFTGPEWLFERKYDGIRLLAFRQGSSVTLLSRNRLKQDMPRLAEAIRRLAVRDVILDGEITWDRSGTYNVFDILWLDGRDVTALPLDERRALLASLPLEAPLQRVEVIDDSAPWELACREGWEGVIAKRRDSVYEHRRSKAWLKMKCELTHDFVVGGFTDPLGSRLGLGALLVGYFDGEEFVFAGKVGTGFDRSLLVELRDRLDAMEIPRSPFTRATGLPRLRAHWVRPEIVVQVAFMEWTVHGKLRHSRLLAVRHDADPREVKRVSP
jgi:ATP-dependent DNA ligase